MTGMEVPLIGTAFTSKFLILTVFICWMKICIRPIQYVQTVMALIVALYHITGNQDIFLVNRIGEATNGNGISTSFFCETYRQLLLMASSSSLVFCLFFNAYYGYCNFNSFNPSGPYKVAHKKIFTSKTKQAVSVFYPMDTDTYYSEASSKPLKQWIDYTG